MFKRLGGRESILFCLPRHPPPLSGRSVKRSWTSKPERGSLGFKGNYFPITFVVLHWLEMERRLEGLCVATKFDAGEHPLEGRKWVFPISLYQLCAPILCFFDSSCMSLFCTDLCQCCLVGHRLTGRPTCSSSARVSASPTTGWSSPSTQKHGLLWL